MDLDSLSDSALSDLIVRASYILQARSNKTTPLPELFFNILVNSLQGATGAAVESWNGLGKSQLKKLVKDTVKLLVAMFDAWSLPSNKSDRVRQFQKATQFAIKSCQQNGLNCDIETVCTVLKRLPLIIDKSFPGYIQNKLVNHIF